MIAEVAAENVLLSLCICTTEIFYRTDSGEDFRKGILNKERKREKKTKEYIQECGESM